VSVPGPNGVTLDAALVIPDGAAKAPAIVAMHDCDRDGSRRNE
jgi:dienelactone hydrolase